MGGQMMDGRQWCVQMRDVLSLACVAPTLARVDEVRALLAAPVAQHLPSEWVTLRAKARDWLAACDASLPRFAGGAALLAAERAMPTLMPAWAAREAEKAAAREAIFQDVEWRN